MATNFWTGSYVPVGSASDVTLLNSGEYNNILQNLYSSMGSNFSQGNSLLQSLGSNYQQLYDNTSNYSNFIKGLLGNSGLYSSLASATNNFDPNTINNTWLSQQNAIAQQANQNVNDLLSDTYSSTREQAQAMSQQAKQQAADQLAAAGLLNSGSGVSALTQAMVNPLLNAETQLAQTRAQAMQNQLGILQQGSLSGLTQGYTNAANLAQVAQQLGLQGMNAQSTQQLAALSGLFNIGSTQAQLGANAQNLIASLSQPQYYNPTYAKQPGALDYLIGAVGAAAPILSKVL